MGFKGKRTITYSLYIELKIIRLMKMIEQAEKLHLHALRNGNSEQIHRFFDG